MPLDEPITPGRVDWTGENPGILLKRPDGTFSAMALFFRVAWSPVGQGQVLLLYGSPDSEEGTPASPNLLISDNFALGEFLKTNFIARLDAFRNASPFEHLSHVDAHSVSSDGDPMSDRYTETVTAEGVTVQLVWEALEPPIALELTPEQVGTRCHTMFTLLVPAQKASIFVNGIPLPGELGTRVQAGMETTTAFLYFSETWVIPPSPGD